MFLQKVKVQRFAVMKKKWGNPPFEKGDGSPMFGSYKKYKYRKLETVENTNPDDVFTIIGQTTVKEGVSNYIGPDEGFGFDEAKTHRVYIVANGLHKRFKLLLKDIEIVEGEENVQS